MRTDSLSRFRFADIECLRNADPPDPAADSLPSGYKHVYHAGTDHMGRDVWHAKVKDEGRLRVVPNSRHTLPSDSAKAVAAWYAGKYGTDWQLYVKLSAKERGRLSALYGAEWVRFARRSREVPYQARHSEKWGGWCVRVWIAGTPEEVPAVKRTNRGWRFSRSKPAVYGSRERAEAGARYYLWVRLGFMAHEWAFRCADLAPACEVR